jgi:hypothetical protein
VVRSISLEKGLMTFLKRPDTAEACATTDWNNCNWKYPFRQSHTYCISAKLRVRLPQGRGSEDTFNLRETK